MLREFADRRDWQQFHSPRNLVLALVGEVGELAAEFQWIADADESRLNVPETKSAIGAEMADVLSYLLRLSDVLCIDLEEAVVTKISQNELRYPVESSRGSARKYTAYE